MGKYDALQEFLRSIQLNINIKSLSFSEIEKILGFKLPSSAYNHRAWWSNPSSPSDHPYAQSWLQAGWRVDSVDQNRKQVHFRRSLSGVITKESSRAIIQSPPSIPQNFKSNEGIKPIPTSESMKLLQNLGFENVGNWALINGTLQFNLRRYGSDRNILYAFIVKDEVMYIGKSTRTLNDRMNGYKNPGPTQNTNIANNIHILNLLKTGVSVEIFVFVDREEITFRGFPINLAAGLEDNLVAKIRPPWNKR